jgi:hypothetical protein
MTHIFPVPRTDVLLSNEGPQANMSHQSSSCVEDYRCVTFVIKLASLFSRGPVIIPAVYTQHSKMTFRITISERKVMVSPYDCDRFRLATKCFHLSLQVRWSRLSVWVSTGADIHRFCRFFKDVQEKKHLKQLLLAVSLGVINIPEIPQYSLFRSTKYQFADIRNN